MWEIGLQKVETFHGVRIEGCKATWVALKKKRQGERSGKWWTCGVDFLFGISHELFVFDKKVVTRQLLSSSWTSWHINYRASYRALLITMMMNSVVCAWGDLFTIIDAPRYVVILRDNLGHLLALSYRTFSTKKMDLRIASKEKHPTNRHDHRIRVHQCSAPHRGTKKIVQNDRPAWPVQWTILNKPALFRYI